MVGGIAIYRTFALVGIGCGGAGFRPAHDLYLPRLVDVDPILRSAGATADA